MPTLYEISSALAAALRSDDDELSPDMEADLTALEMALEQKIEGVLQYRQGLVADAAAFQSEAARLQAKADAITRKAEWLKTYVLQTMTAVGVDKVSTRTFTASVRKSPARVEIAEGAEIPEPYRVEKVTIIFDRAAVLAAHRDGKPLPEAVRITHGTYLQIK